MSMTQWGTCPIFIHDRHEVYFREDYNYLEDVFEIANTLDEIVWQDMFGPEQSKFMIAYIITLLRQPVNPIV